MDDPRAQEILDFWFGDRDETRAVWFKKDAAFDAQIAERFGALVEDALAGRLDAWDRDPDSALARILLLDQFTRNIFRGSARAFAGDAQALQSARALVASGQDRRFSGVRRQFTYLPFEHAEDLAHQRTSVQLFEQLARDEPALAGLVEWARRHEAVVARFGRFPHRNAALGRASSAEELDYVSQPGTGF